MEGDCLTSLIHFSVELRKAIASDIPGLLELLKSKYSYFRTAAALAFSEIADYGQHFG